MGRTSRRIGWFLTCLLACVVVLGAAPGVARAETVQYVDENGNEASANATTVTPDSTTWSSGWYVATSEVIISSRVTVSGNVSLILADGADLTVTRGIEVGASDSLTVYAQSGGTGRLEANASEDYGFSGI